MHHKAKKILAEIQGKIDQRLPQQLADLLYYTNSNTIFYFKMNRIHAY